MILYRRFNNRLLEEEIYRSLGNSQKNIKEEIGSPEVDEVVESSMQESLEESPLILPDRLEKRMGKFYF